MNPRLPRSDLGPTWGAGLGLILGLLTLTPAFAADVVPTDVKMPGTQPENAITPLEPVGFCANCHGNYDQAVEPLFNWHGSMMSHSSRDPVFWATLAVAEQDFDGAGDLCIRCHSAAGWLEGRSTPTDGSALDPLNDIDGIECDLCHRLTNPDGSEHLGVQVDPFVAISGDPAEAHYGSGQYVLAGGSGTKYGPYADANPPAGAHAAARSRFHRSPELCGTCHDVSNPAVGDLAYNHGAQIPLDGITELFSGVPGDPVATKAAFNNPPYKYGIVERTYSEHKAGLLGSTLVRDYAALPAELQAGAIQRAYEAALLAGRAGDYADGTPRYFTCQTCHLRPVTGKGANRPLTGRFVPPVRTDLPMHDLTGGNYWMPEAIKWLDARGRLVVGGGLTAADIAALDAGALRARENLEDAATLSVAGNTVKVVNLTSHKLISGYPEGRRMWLNIRWRSSNGALLREDGAYGDLTVEMDLDGDGETNDTVRTLLDLGGTNTRIYEVHHAITPTWAAQLLDLGYPPDMVVSYDRVTGQPSVTLQHVAEGTKYEESLHFVLNDYVSYDRRVPPYGFSYDEAMRRNALPVPETQFGNPGPGGTYRHWDEVPLNPPQGAASAEIRLLYQPTSWEYVQFLYLANPGTGILANAGRDYLEAWLATGMAEPHVMATGTWTSNGPGPNQPPVASFTANCTDLSCSFDASASVDPDGNIVAYAWDFGDGSTASGVTASRTYAAAGSYTVTLIVTDDRGATASTVQDVTVTALPVNQPPTASFTFTCTDLTCSFNGGGSSDPDGTISTYAWTFGDGATAAGVTASHTFAVAGTYNVALTVTDNGGLTGTLTQHVNVTAPAPQPGPGPGPRR